MWMSAVAVWTVSYVYVGICVPYGTHCVVVWSGVFVNFLIAVTKYLKKSA